MEDIDLLNVKPIVSERADDSSGSGKWQESMRPFPELSCPGWAGDMGQRGIPSLLMGPLLTLDQSREASCISAESQSLLQQPP